MEDILAILILAFAVSLDSFMVAFTYGLRQMTLPLKSILIIGLTSGVIFFLAMTVGDLIALVLSERVTELIGGGLLILLGIWGLFSFYRSEKKDEQRQPFHLKLEIKSLGIVIQILKKPLVADFDKSGHITGLEVLILAIALSIDAFAAGIGAALIGMPIISVIGIGIATSLFLFIGLKAGKIFSHSNQINFLRFIPGVLLIILGLFRII